MLCTWDVNQTTHQMVKKEGAVRFGFPLDETNRQNWLRNIPRHFENITRNTRVCIKHFEEKDVHTFDLHTNHDGSTYRVSYTI